MGTLASYFYYNNIYPEMDKGPTGRMYEDGNKEIRKKGKKEKRKKLSALQVYLVPHWIPVLPGLIIGRVGMYISSTILV